MDTAFASNPADTRSGSALTAADAVPVCEGRHAARKQKRAHSVILLPIGPAYKDTSDIVSHDTGTHTIPVTGSVGDIAF